MTTVSQSPETKTTKPPAPIVFTTTYADLTAGLQAAALAIPSRPPVPVLGGVLMESIDSGPRLTTCDFDVHMRVSVPATSYTEGRLLVDHRSMLKALTGLVKGIPSKEAAALRVEIRADTPSAPTVTVAGYTVPLKALPIVDYPTPEPALPPVVAQVRRKKWLAELARVLSAVSTDDTRPALVCVLVELADRAMRMTCTDRFRLTTASVDALMLQDAELTATALVPGHTLSKLVARLKDVPDEWVRVGLDLTDGAISFTSGNVTLATRLMNATFPDYRNLLPTEQAGHATVNLKALKQQVQRAQIVMQNLDDTIGSVAMRIQPGGVSVRVRLTERDDQVKVPLLPAAVADCDTEVWFNPKNLLNCLDTFTGDTVTVFPSPKPFGPALVCDHPSDFGFTSAYRHLLMPVRQPDDTK